MKYGMDKTVQTIDNNTESMDFFDRLSDTLGFNDNTEVTRAIIAKTNDYSKFINTNISELNAILKNPVYDEDNPMYQKLKKWGLKSKATFDTIVS